MQSRLRPAKPQRTERRCVTYSISYVGGVGFRDDPHLVSLADVGLRPAERFVYVYDFTDGWRLDLRLEQILIPAGSTLAAPVAVGPARRRPAAGVWAFLEQTQPHHVLAATLRAGEILSLLLEAEDLTRFGEHRDELAALLPLLVRVAGQ